MPLKSFKVTTWGPERPPMVFSADTAAEAYKLVLNKAVYASLEVRVADPDGHDLSLEALAEMARQEAD